MSNKFEQCTNVTRRFSTYPNEEFIKALGDLVRTSAKTGGYGIYIKSLYKKELVKNENENWLYQLSEYVLNHQSLLEFGGYEVIAHRPIGLYRTIDIYKI